MTQIHSQAIDDPIYKAPLAAISHINRRHLMKNIALFLIFSPIYAYIVHWHGWVIALGVGLLAPWWGWRLVYPIAEHFGNRDMNPESRNILGASGLTFILVGGSATLSWWLFILLSVAVVMNEVYRNLSESYLVVGIHFLSFISGVVLGILL